MVKNKGREVGVSEGWRLSWGINAPATLIHGRAGAYSIFTEIFTFVACLFTRIFTFPSYNGWRNEFRQDREVTGFQF